MLDLRQVRAFVQVAREGSFTRAAAQLHYAQSSVTARVQQLEQQLAVPLLDRLPRGVRLTNAGRGFLEYAERLLQLSEEAEQSMRVTGEIAGPLTLSASESVLTYRLPQLLRSFQSRYPRVQITLDAASVCETGPPLGTSVDIAISINEPVQAPHLVSRMLRAEPVYAVVSPDHPLAAVTRPTAADIVAHQLLFTEGSCSYRALFERTLAAAGARPQRTLEFASVEAIKQCAHARMGVAVLPAMVVAADLDAAKLIAVPWPRPQMRVYTQLVRRRDRWFSPAMKAFWSAAVEMLTERAAGGAKRTRAAA